MNIKEAFPSAPAGPALRDQVSARALEIHAGHLRAKRTRRSVLGLLIMVGLIAGGVLVGPSAYAIYRLNKIAGSLDDCRTMLREDFDIDEAGRQTLRGRTVYSDGKWRIERKDRTQVYEAGILWVYDAKTRRVLKLDKPDGPFGYNASGASVKSLLRDMTSWNWRAKPSVGSAVREGRRMVTVMLDQEEDRVVVYADEKTNMPVLFEAFRKEGGGLRLAGVSRPKFNVAVDAREFVRNFPSDAKVIDVGKIKSTWAAKIEKPVETIRFEKGEIQIRDYVVNERGHVFIVYSNGEKASDRAEYARRMHSSNPMRQEAGFGVDFEVKDSLGNEYIRSSTSFQPYMGGYGGRPSEWVELRDGTVMQGAWLYTSAIQPWRPRTLEVKMSHGSESKIWTLDVPQPTTKLIPEWFYALAIAPLDWDQLMQEENRGRRIYYYQKGDHAKLIPLIHEEIERLQEFERENRRRISLMDLYYGLYEAHRGLGQTTEALHFLELASKEPDPKGTYSGGIMVDAGIVANAMKREGLR